MPITVGGYTRPKSGWSENSGIAYVHVGQRNEKYNVFITDGVPLLKISKHEPAWVKAELKKIAKRHNWTTEEVWEVTGNFVTGLNW